MKRVRQPIARPDIGPRERALVLEALREGGISSQGRHVAAFERAFAERMRAPEAVAVASGTAALHLALAALRIGPGDEVIVPDLTFVATANAVRYTGARVVLADVDPATWTLDPRAVERALTRRTRAILAVHLFGNPADLDALSAIARARRIALIEDAAQGLGARWRGRPVGGVGRLTTFSLFASKVVTTGEGGMVLARSRALAERLRHLRDHGMSRRRRYYHDELAFNYRMGALQAALGLAQLERLDGFLAARERIGSWYRAALADCEGLSEPEPLAHATPVLWMYTVRVAGWSRRQRDAAMQALHAQGVDSRPAFVPMSQLPMYRERPLPVAAAIAASTLSLPTHTLLRRRDVEQIAAALRRVLAR